ncbi:trypsin-like peptidase domain-containing protein [Kitasatospora sp. NPDC058965]|uniref:nSTAND1 domain-containing NTPase n=1 Tax=Kitasatospora sp. NPDC058965 TaxID=3346682 RepID=UPI0036A1952F
MTALPPGGAAGAGPKALTTGVVRILGHHDGAATAGTSWKPVGVGFLVTPELVVTCAHVVSAALRLQGADRPPAQAVLDVDLPLLPSALPPDGAGSPLTARVEHWVPPEPSGAGDVAVLRLGAPVPGARPVPLVRSKDLWGHSARVFGFPDGRDAGVWHEAVLRDGQANGWVQADRSGNSYRVSPGFSGSPVWDDALAGVVGMMVRAEAGEPPASYLIPVERLVAAWPELGELAVPPSPFRSLTAFQEADRRLFHGRSTESRELARLVGGQRWTTVVGPSGSGKSSLAMAGVLPLLRAGGSTAVVLRPAAGSSPLSALAAALLPLLEPELSETDRLARLPGLTRVLADRNGFADAVPRVLALQRAHRLVVLVDQFEELLVRSPAAVDPLADVLFDEALPDTVRVLSTLRADFLETALAHPRLGLAFGRPAYVLRPLGPDQLREVVTAPVDAVPGVDYQPGLVDSILRDAGDEPGALPLLGFTLDQLWHRQHEGLLTHQAYARLGRVQGALGAYATAVWADHVPPEDGPTARRLLTRLVRVPTETAAATRRTALRPDLTEDEWRIAQRLATTRLLVTGSSAEGVDTVELAHEALITGWTDLAQWSAADRAFLVWRESVRHDLERWERGGRVPELLPTRVALTGAETWLAARGDDLTEAERDYLDRGSRHQRSRGRRRRAAVAALGFVLALALVFGSLFVAAQQQSREHASAATSQALAQAAQNEAGDDPPLSVLLSLAAYRTAPTQDARNELLRQYLAASGAARILSGLKGTVGTIRTSADGSVVLADSRLGRATLFVHAVSGVVRSQEVPSANQLDDVMLARDGRRGAFLDQDGSVEWFQVNPDATDPVGPLQRLPAVPGWPDGASLSAMSPDGRMLAVATQTRVAWWDLGTGSVVGTAAAPAGSYLDLWFGPDNGTLLVRTESAGDAPEGLVALDLATGAPRTVLSAKSYVLSGDRTTAVTCSDDGDAGHIVLSRYAVADGTRQGPPHPLDGAYCPLQAIDATGHRVVLTTGFKGNTQSLELVDLDQDTVVSRTSESGDSPTDFPSGSPVLAADGGRLFLVGGLGARIVFTEIPTDAGVLDVGQQALTRDGSKLISILADGSDLELRAATGDDSRPLVRAARARPVWDAAGATLRLSRDGRLLAEREGADLVSVRDTSDLRQTLLVRTAAPPSDDPKVEDFAYFFDAGGNLVTVSGTLVQQWDARTGRQLAQYDAAVLQPGTDSDGSPQLYVSSYPAANEVTVIVYGDPRIRVVDLTTGRTTMTLQLTDDIKAAQFDAAGNYFALMRSGGQVELWRRDPLRRELGLLRSLTAGSTPGDAVTVPQFAGAFLDDRGRFVLAANNVVQIYRIGDRAYVDSYDFGRPPYSTSASPYSFLDVSADGRTVLYADENGVGGPLQLDPAVWQRKLCDVIGYRGFTADERSSLPVAVPAQPLCPRP